VAALHAKFGGNVLGAGSLSEAAAAAAARAPEPGSMKQHRERAIWLRALQAEIGRVQQTTDAAAAVAVERQLDGPRIELQRQLVPAPFNELDLDVDEMKDLLGVGSSSELVLELWDPALATCMGLVGPPGSSHDTTTWYVDVLLSTMLQRLRLADEFRDVIPGVRTPAFASLLQGLVSSFGAMQPVHGGA
jgi:hypothetical protein